jgi:glycosyltransferase involved in cell wall biosynthesis
MRVLLLSQVLPYPPDSGPKVKTYNVLKYLAQHHEVTLVSFIRGDQSRDVEQLRHYCRSIHVVPITRGAAADAAAMARSVLSGQPWMMVRDDRVDMRMLVDRLARESAFDVAHADQLNMAQYAARVPQARKVLDAHNALWLLYKRLAATMKPGMRRALLERDWRLLKRYEGRVCRSFGGVLAVSAEDKAALLEAMSATMPAVSEADRRKIVVIPIAVDGDEVRPVVRRPDADHILHIGTMYWPPNIDGVKWFIDQVLPRIRAERPDVRFDVVGARPPQELIDLGASDGRINVTGYVENPEPYLQRAGAMIVPLRAGGGMRVKILNAMAQALPIVTTTLGCEGIAVEPGRHVLVADTPDEFARSTLNLLQDRVRADGLGHNGRALVDALYDYRAACKPLEGVYR